MAPLSRRLRQGLTFNKRRITAPYKFLLYCFLWHLEASFLIRTYIRAHCAPPSAAKLCSTGVIIWLLEQNRSALQVLGHLRSSKWRKSPLSHISWCSKYIITHSRYPNKIIYLNIFVFLHFYIWFVSYSSKSHVLLLQQVSIWKYIWKDDCRDCIIYLLFKKLLWAKAMELELRPEVTGPERHKKLLRMM